MATKRLPQLRDVASDQQTNGSTLMLKIDRDKASRYGISAQEVDNTLYDAFGQRFVAQYYTQLNSYHVVLEILPALQGQPDSLDKIFLSSAGGQQVPLSTFAQWTTEPVRPASDTAHPRTERRAHRCRHSSATPTMGPVAGALTMVFGAGAACLLDPTLLEPGPGLVVGAGLTGLVVVVPSRRGS